MSADQTGRVYLTGYLDVPSDRWQAVRAALPIHIELIRAEAGCIAFEVTEDQQHPRRLLVSEVFENQAAFDAHQERTRQSAWFKVTEGIERHYSITTDPA